jgi:dTDP-4-dehydrorhamnose reductase
MKFFLTGGTGQLGTELQKHLNCVAPKKREFNIIDKQSLYYYYLKSFDGNMSTIIHCAAYTDVPKAEADKIKVIETNINGTKNVADCFKNQRIVYISTDYVYNGTGNHKETDQTRPVNFYGFTKLAGEAYLDLNKDLIIRTSFKPSKWKYKRAFIDIYTSADYIDVVAKDIALLVQSNITGIINVGTKRKSVYELAQMRNPHVGKMSKNEVDDVSLPIDISMNLEKLNKFKNKMEEE